MTAPSIIYCEATQGSGATIPAGTTVTGPQPGDFCIITQGGTTTGAGSSSVPTGGDSLNPFTKSVGNGVTAEASQSGRAVQFFKTLSVGDFSGSNLKQFTLDTSLFTGHRATIQIVRHANGFNANACFDAINQTASIVAGTSITNTANGGTIRSVARPKISVAVMARGSANISSQPTWNGVSRNFYFDKFLGTYTAGGHGSSSRGTVSYTSGTATINCSQAVASDLGMEIIGTGITTGTTITAVSVGTSYTISAVTTQQVVSGAIFVEPHYGFNNASAAHVAADYNEWDASDTISTVSFTGDTGNTTHVIVYASYQALSDPVVVSDAVGVSSSVPSNTSATRGLSETVGISDSLHVLGPVRFMDTVGIEATISGTESEARTFSDTVGVSATSTAAVAQTRSANDALGITNAITVSGRVILAETVGLPDVVSATVANVRVLSDTVAISATFAVSFAQTRSFPEAVGITDMVSVTGKIFLGESVGITDTVAGFVTATRPATNAVGVSESFSSSFSQTKTFSETVEITATISTRGPIANTNAVGITDTVRTGSAITVDVQAGTGLYAQLNSSTGSRASFAEAVDITDQVGFGRSFLAALTDAVGILNTNTTGYRVRELDYGLSDPGVGITAGTLFVTARSVNAADDGDIQLAILDGGVPIATSAWQPLTTTFQIFSVATTGITNPAALTAQIFVRTIFGVTAQIGQVYFTPTVILTNTIGVSGSIGRTESLVTNISDRVGITNLISLFQQSPQSYSASFGESLGVHAIISTQSSKRVVLVDLVDISGSVAATVTEVPTSHIKTPTKAIVSNPRNFVVVAPSDNSFTIGP